jgi:hypothetical protein
VAYQNMRIAIKIIKPMAIIMATKEPIILSFKINLVINKFHAIAIPHKMMNIRIFTASYERFRKLDKIFKSKTHLSNASASGNIYLMQTRRNKKQQAIPYIMLGNRYNPFPIDVFFLIILIKAINGAKDDSTNIPP